jgi:lipoate-protein ligase B
MGDLPPPALDIYRLGRRDYSEVLNLQRALCRARLEGRVHSDLLLLVEHPPVVTLGRGTKPESLPMAPSEIEKRGVEVHEVERGGDVTYHGPGQLVGYPILDLQSHRPDLHWYLRQLEAGLINALGSLDILAGQTEGLTGVWTNGRKIASIGVHVKQWVRSVRPHRAVWHQGCGDDVRGPRTGLDGKPRRIVVRERGGRRRCDGADIRLGTSRGGPRGSRVYSAVGDR